MNVGSLVEYKSKHNVRLGIGVIQDVRKTADSEGDMKQEMLIRWQGVTYPKPFGKGKSKVTWILEDHLFVISE